MHKIVLASSIRRALAAFVDFVFALFIGLGVFAAAQAIMLATPLGKSRQQTLTNYYVSSGLYYIGEDGSITFDEEVADYKYYENIVVKYYTEYCVSGCPEESRDNKYSIYWYNVHIVGLDDVKGIYSTADLDAREYPGTRLGKSLFQYDGTNYDSLPVVNESLYVGGVVPDVTKKDLKNFYYSGDSQSVYFNAAKHLSSQPFFTKASEEYNVLSNTYPLLIAVGIVYPIYYLLIPLLFKNGETLAKKLFHLCLANNNGFQIKKYQLVMRSMPLFVLSLISFVFLGTTGGVFLTLGMLIVSYALVLFTKNKKSIHDFMALTLVLNEKESLFYRNIDEQEIAEASYIETMQRAEAVREAVDLTEGNPNIEKPTDHKTDK